MTTIILKHHKEESLKRFHPWVFSGAIARIEDEFGSPVQPEEGDWVRVVSDGGEFLALGQYQIGSIAVRIFSFDEDDLDETFFLRRLQSAYELRRTLGLIRPDNNAYRLVHGEGDGLPGLIIDVYDGTAVMQAHTAGIHYIREALAEDLIQVAGADIRNVYYKSETTLSYKTDARQEAEAEGESVNGYLIIDGKPVTSAAAGKQLESTISDVALENGLKFHVDWLKGQKTGFFVDQRENRALVEKYSAGRRVLNMFCYTGGFSFYAMRSNATLVHSVDVSKQAISFTNANVELNFPGDSRHKAFAADAFDFLDGKCPGSLFGEGEPGYDLIILDPPAFAKHKKVLRNALRGYQRLNAKALEKIRPGGILFTFSCSQVVTKDDFRCAVFSAAAQTGRRVRILHQLHQPADHPINIYHPEGEYLKGLVLYVE
ncbi:MAG: class I SAM-dependent rRNA methyltransferase [Bacteroidales bacterium]|nr:class I SAM-dependent rRNA methyltransferase [Bacteroidales bacterium]MBP5214209.1 class I SAM-dependent rRNA methyltransferase [Bacteroidales bacterium]